MGEETKPLGMSGEKSERLRSTAEAGEPTRGTPSREGERRATEPVDGEEAGRQQCPRTFYTGLDWVAELARRKPDEALTTLSHHIDVDLLRRAYQRTRKNGAPGVDGVTAKAYEGSLDENLADLARRFRSGTYRAPPVKRVHIPKGDGKTRPIGIPTFEDKVLQRAVTMVLEPIYEHDFRDCSYGFRPKRSAHQALEVLRDGLMRFGGGFVLEVDIQLFFDSLVHAHLRTFLDGRVRDGVIRRMIDKWLKAGLLENGRFMRPEEGTPQGGVISPLLANVYLHHVLDVWFEDEIKHRLTGRSFLVRYADDFVIVFEREEDARRVMAVLPKRFGKYGLTLHPEKTRLVPFKKPPRRRREGSNGSRPGSFVLLGFTHYWAKSRRDYWVVKKKTSGNSMRRAVARVKTWLRSVMHESVRDQHKGLCRRVRGHYNYFGVTGNSPSTDQFRRHVVRRWHRVLARRSQHGHVPWKRFIAMLEHFPVPAAQIEKSVRPSAASP